jgi:hypothetical protein
MLPLPTLQPGPPLPQQQQQQQQAAVRVSPAPSSLDGECWKVGAHLQGRRRYGRSSAAAPTAHSKSLFGFS